MCLLTVQATTIIAAVYLYSIPFSDLILDAFGDEEGLDACSTKY